MGKHLRLFAQAGWTLATNGYIPGFLKGAIYQGPLKQSCLPGLNCYSCPGAIGSCPIGSLQAVMGSRQYSISLYIIGFFAIVGAVCGRFVCGWLCPFGLLQDLLHRIPFVKKVRRFKFDRPLRYLKFAILLVFVILLPLFVVDVIGQGAPYFCKYICPSGTLLGGWPLVAMNEPLQATIGWLFAWKNLLLAIVVVLSCVLYRPFCKYLCPLGAVYALFNGFSLYKLQIDRQTCTHCGACARVCKMNVDPCATPNHPECIRCGDCKKACPCGAVCAGIARRPKSGEQTTRT